MSRVTKLLLFIAATFISLGSVAKSISNDRALNREYRRVCMEIKKYSVKSAYSVDCYTNYHHFNSDAAYRYYSSTNASKIKIAGYNLWHPGNPKSSYKDYKIMAKLMNKFDLVSAVELLAAISRDADNNENVVDFLYSAPSVIRKLEASSSSESKRKLAAFKKDYEVAKTLYREPGYLKVLNELRKLDRSWALILTPRGDAGKPTHVHELAGFYYRAKVVKPIVNDHCKSIKESGDGEPIACFPNLRASFMGRDTSGVFSRRPFLGSFKSRNFDFSLLTSHVVFTSPSDSSDMRKILKPSFGVSNYTSVGRGVSKVTYARFAESKIILEFMEKYRAEYNDKDIIYVGDMNLESSKTFWDKIMPEFPGSELLVTGGTSLALTRYDVDRKPTKGETSNYDHFIADPKVSSECFTSSGRSTAKPVSYYSGDIHKAIMSKYIVRSTNKSNFDFEKDFDDSFEEDFSPTSLSIKYRMTSAGKAKMNKLLATYEKSLKARKTIRRNQVIIDEESKIKEKVKLFKKRMFLEQQYDRTFYRVYKEVLSDHFPVEMTCKTSLSDDDK